MKYFQEVTVWDAGYPVPNHTYYMKDDRSAAVGYIPVGSRKYVKFSKPLKMDVKGRKFVALARKGEPDSIYFKVEADKPSGLVKEIQGSGGKTYFLSKIGSRWRCTCPGFTFRHTCKHITEAGD